MAGALHNLIEELFLVLTLLMLTSLLVSERDWPAFRHFSSPPIGRTCAIIFFRSMMALREFAFEAIVKRTRPRI